MDSIFILLSMLVCMIAYFQFQANYIKIDDSESIEITIRLATETIVFLIFWVGILITLSILIFVEETIIEGMSSLILPCYFAYSITLQTVITSKGITTVDILGRRCRQQLEWDMIERYEITEENKVIFYYRSKQDKLIHLSIEVNKNQIEKIEEVVSKYLKNEVVQVH